MGRRLMVVLFVLLLVFAACSDDDTTTGGVKDSRLFGLWNGFADFGSGNAYTELEMTASGYVMYVYDDGQFNTNMNICEQSTKGNWHTDGTSLVVEVTHAFSNEIADNADDWYDSASPAQYHTYTVSGTNTGDVLAMTMTNGGSPTTLYLTNRLPYEVLPSVAGTWVTSITDTVEFMGTVVAYQTNVIQADGRFISTMVMQLTNVPAPLSNAMMVRETGKVYVNNAQDISLRTCSQVYQATNFLQVWLMGGDLQYGTSPSSSRERTPISFPDGNTMVISAEDGPMIFIRQ